MERLGELSFEGYPYCYSVSMPLSFLQEVCYQYWPADSTKGVQKYGEFTVSVLKVAEQEDGFIQRNISITNPKVMDEYEKRLVCSNWCSLLTAWYLHFIPYTVEPP